MIQMLVPDVYTFSENDCTLFVVHKTAGFETAEDCASYFQRGAPDANGNLRMVSAHYVVGLNGEIVQCVLESRGAAGNCCVEPGHADFIPDTWDGRRDNGNVHSISTELIDPTIDNSTPVPDAQLQALVSIARGACERHNIPKRRARNDGQGGICGHMDFDPISRAHCPGNFPWDRFYTLLIQGDTMIPTGWKDDGKKLLCPNGHFFIAGFRDHVLNATSWDAGNVALEEETHVAQVELHTQAGAGQRQLTRDKMLIYTTSGGVAESATGLELQAAYTLINSLQAQVKTLQSTALATKLAQAATLVDQIKAVLTTTT